MPPCDDMDARLLLAEWGRRNGFGQAADAQSLARDQQRERFAKAAAWLISTHHPKQRAFCSSRSWLAAAFTTRRAGKNHGCTRQMLADALLHPGWWQIYVNETRAEAVRLVWDGPPEERDGLLPLLHDAGLKLNVDYETNATQRRVTILHIGESVSYIDLAGADKERDVNKLRGGNYDRVWLDEAQKLRHIETLIRGSLMPAMMKRGRSGQIWLTGTPSIECAGLFYEVTNLEEPTPGWDVHRWSVRDNPYYGDTPEERWQNTGEKYLKDSGRTADDPDFRREWGPEWVKEGARYVYAIHGVPLEDRCYAPIRELEDGFYDHAAALLDLPKRADGKLHPWRFAGGLDFGWYPAPFALTLWAFSDEAPDIYEMWSWKKTKLLPDDQLALVKRLLSVVELAILVGDPAGVQDKLTAWRERGGVWIEEADKNQKGAWREMLNADIRCRRVHYRKGSVLLDEHEHLQWRRQTSGNAKPEEWADRMLPGKRVPGNHCSDGFVYVSRHLTHYRFQEQPPKPVPGTPEYAQAVEAAIDDEQDRHEEAFEEMQREEWYD